MRIEFDIAGRADDAAIRGLLAANPMPGAVTVAFEREPDYFLGHGVMGERCVTVKAVDSENGRLAGITCVAASNRFINGEVTPVGYIGQLRIDHAYRGLLIPLRAMRFIRQLVRAGWPDLWFNALSDENREAMVIFAERPRRSFPELQPVAPIQTLGIVTRPQRRARGSSGVVIRRGDEVGLDSIVQFLRCQGQRREFFPVYTAEDFALQPVKSRGSRTPGFRLSDFVVALSQDRLGDGRIVGVCGVWDQSSFKQTIVHGYRGMLRPFRGVINAAGPLFGLSRLPGVGEPIESAYVSFLAVEDDDAGAFGVLLDGAVGVAHSLGKSYLLAGFSEGDPLLSVARRYRHILYSSTMYAYTFGGVLAPDAFDRSKIPYLEIAAL